MQLNTQQLRAEVEGKIARLEVQKKNLENQMAAINEKVRHLQSTQEVLQRVIEQIGQLDRMIAEVGSLELSESDFEAGPKSRVDTAVSKESSSPADIFEPVPAGKASPSTQDDFEEEDEETLRMVESLFIESDLDHADEPVRPNGRSKASAEEANPVGLEVEHLSSTNSSDSGNSDSLVPRFLKRYL